MDPSTTNTTFFGKLLTLGQILASRLVWLCALIVIGIAAWFLLPMLQGSIPSATQEQAESRSAQTVFVETLRLRDQETIQIPIWYTGDIVAARKTQISFPRGGKIIDIKVDEGEQVAADQLLAILDSRQVKARYDQLVAQSQQTESQRNEMVEGPRGEAILAARGNVNEVEEQLRNARTAYARAKRLIAQGGISRQEYDQADANLNTLAARKTTVEARLAELTAGTRVEQLNAAEANWNAANAAVALAKADMDDCQLTAPFAGSIVRRMLDEGAVVEGGTPVFLLVENENLEFHVGLPARIANTLASHSTLTLEVDGVEARASFKSKTQILDRQTLTQRVILQVESNLDSLASLGLVDGQIGRVQFQQPFDSKGFKIPTTAIVDDQQGLWSCFVVSENADGDQVAKRQSIEVLHFQGDWVYVRGTLSNGQSLVVKGLQRLAHGQLVQPVQNQQTDVDGAK